MVAKEKFETFKAGLVIIGNEILSGRTQDTNTGWIANKLVEQGVQLQEVRIVSDDEDEIVFAVNEMRAKLDYVFTTGGIGPTHDDITAEAIAKAFGTQLERNETAFKMLEDYYGLEELTPSRTKMCLVPQGAELIENQVSGAPGFYMENVYVMAGIPRIMQTMLSNVLGKIGSGDPVLSNTITCDLPESEMAEDLGVLQAKFPAVEMGSYPSFRGGSLGLSLVLRATNKDKLKEASEALIAIIREHGQEPAALSLQVMIDDE